MSTNTIQIGRHCRPDQAPVRFRRIERRSRPGGPDVSLPRGRCAVTGRKAAIRKAS